MLRGRCGRHDSGSESGGRTLVGVRGGPGGRSLPEMFTEPERREEFLRRIEQDGLVREARVSLETYGGTVIDVAVSASAVRVEGRLTGFFGSIRDVTLETQDVRLLADMARFPAAIPTPSCAFNVEASHLRQRRQARRCWRLVVKSAGAAMGWSEETRRCAANAVPASSSWRSWGGVADLLLARGGPEFPAPRGFDITARRRRAGGRPAGGRLGRANEQFGRQRAAQRGACGIELMCAHRRRRVRVRTWRRETIMNHAATELHEVKGTNGSGNRCRALLGDCTPIRSGLKEALVACVPFGPRNPRWNCTPHARARCGSWPAPGSTPRAAWRVAS